jgi:biopolymer transport protein TolQ
MRTAEAGRAGVLRYNILSGQVMRYAQQLESFAGEFITILSRQLEEQV